jgi:hypothetical protein
MSAYSWKLATKIYVQPKYMNSLFEFTPTLRFGYITIKIKKGTKSDINKNNKNKHLNKQSEWELEYMLVVIYQVWPTLSDVICK